MLIFFKINIFILPDKIMCNVDKKYIFFFLDYTVLTKYKVDNLFSTFVIIFERDFNQIAQIE